MRPSLVVAVDTDSREPKRFPRAEPAPGPVVSVGMPRATLLWVALALVACEKPPEETIPAPPTAAPYDHQAYCQTVCERAAKCGAEAAEPLRSDGDPPSEGMLRDATAACVSGCRSEAPAAGIATERVEICMRRDKCDELESCLEAL